MPVRSVIYELCRGYVVVRDNTEIVTHFSARVPKPRNVLLAKYLCSSPGRDCSARGILVTRLATEFFPFK